MGLLVPALGANAHCAGCRRPGSSGVLTASALAAAPAPAASSAAALSLAAALVCIHKPLLVVRRRFLTKLPSAASSAARHEKSVAAQPAALPCIDDRIQISIDKGHQFDAVRGHHALHGTRNRPANQSLHAHFGKLARLVGGHLRVKGHPGLGGYDIFYIKVGAGHAWKTARNIGYPINTRDDELAFFVSTDGKLAYFASNKIDGNECVNGIARVFHRFSWRTCFWICCS